LTQERRTLEPLTLERLSLDPQTFQKCLLEWYDRGHRRLPWRVPDATGRPNPWHILVSEFMLQQTRVEAVIPYFHRFLKQFPDPRALAEASEPEILAAWSGLGYYSRIRNLQLAAKVIACGFPASYSAIRELPGVGPYTAAAVASIGFDLPYAVADGNVFRVLSRYTGDAADIGFQDTRERLTEIAQCLLDPHRPGDFNQAMMELGATVCLPRSPQCLLCPIAANCIARQQGRQAELPVKSPKPRAEAETLNVLILEGTVKSGRVLLLRRRPPDVRRMPGFWELPTRDAVPGVHDLKLAGQFVHTIVNTRYQVQVWTGSVSRKPAGMPSEMPDEMTWTPFDNLTALPLTTISKKALTCAYSLRAIAGNA
jgi:A/G-specific adenine glycosylase